MIDRLITTAFAIRYQAARRLMVAGDPAPLPEVPLFEDVPDA